PRASRGQGFVAGALACIAGARWIPLLGQRAMLARIDARTLKAHMGEPHGRDCYGTRHADDDRGGFHLVRSPARIIGRILVAVLVLVVAFLVLTPIGRYLAKAAWEEGKILVRRRSISALIASPSTDPVTRAKLQLVLEARTFAADSL